MSGSVTNTAAPASTGSTAIDSAIASMQAAFNEAIVTNTQITTLKTELGAQESAAQQRPNIG